MITLDNQTHYPLSTDTLEAILSWLSTREVELTLCDDATIATLNAQYRSQNRATDVLSFPIESDFEFMPLGSVVISLDRATQVATELGHTIDDEIALLFIHGVLHLLGYDHEVDGGEMRAKEVEIIEVFGLPLSLIVRTQEG